MQPEPSPPVHITWYHHRRWREPHGTDGYRRLGCWVVLLGHDSGYRYREVDEPWIDVAPDQVVALPPGRWHRLRFPVAGRVSGVHCYVGDATSGERSCPVPVPAAAETRLRRLLLDLCRRLTAQASADGSIVAQLRCRASANELAADLLDFSHPARRPVDEAALVRLAPLLARVRAQPDRAWTRDLLAQEAGCSTAHLHRLCKQAYGLAPMVWLRGERLRRAWALLDDGYQVQAAAAAVGFTDAFHFSRCFRREFGLAPSRIRG